VVPRAKVVTGVPPAPIPVESELRFMRTVYGSILPATVDRVMVIGAHPDDIDFYAAGTVATWTKAGVDVKYCILTDGAAGGFECDRSRAKTARLRRVEQLAAASEVGVSDVVFLDRPDGRLQPDEELCQELVDLIRRARPQRVLCPSPDRNWNSVYASHPDHLAAGEATLRAVYPAARNVATRGEVESGEPAPCEVSEVWLMGAEEANVFVDVTETFPEKLAAIRRHVSQLVRSADLEVSLRAYMQELAAQGSIRGDRLAEAFRATWTL